MGKLYDEFKDKGFIVLAINMREGKETIEKYMKKQILPFPVLLDTGGKVANLYGVRIQPDHYLINRRGELIGRALGGKDWGSKEVISLIQFLVENER